MGVVDSEEQMIPLAPVDDRTERVADVQGAGGAGREADLLHRANLIGRTTLLRADGTATALFAHVKIRQDYRCYPPSTRVASSAKEAV
jgi:hypothetical protein